MKALMNQNDNSYLNKQTLRSILELQALLNDYRLEGNAYDQDRIDDLQTAIDALDILTIRILNEQ